MKITKSPISGMVPSPLNAQIYVTKHLFTLPLIFIIALTACGQTRETYDLLTYTAQKGWSKEEGKDFIVYQTVGKKDGSWCQFLIYKSVPTQGGVEAYWNHDWQQLLVTPNQITDASRTEPAREAVFFMEANAVDQNGQPVFVAPFRKGNTKTTPSTS